MSNNIHNNLYDDLSINGSLTYDSAITTGTRNGVDTITLDKDVIITCDSKTVKVGDLFRKLEILDRIIKEQYSEELLI